MKRMGKVVLMIAASMFAVVPLLSQTKPAFDVVSIRTFVMEAGGRGLRIGGGARGNRYTMSGANLRMLLQQGYSQASNMGPGGQLQIIGGPNWMDSDRWDVQATVDCAGGQIQREQLQLMIQSMLEDRFKLKAHMETRELPIYNLVLAKDGPKIKASADQTPPGPAGGGPPLPCAPASGAAGQPPTPPVPLPPPGQRGSPTDPNFVPPRGSMIMMMSPTGMTLQAGAMPITNLVGMLQNQVGRPVIDKTGLKGLFDFKLQFSPEGLQQPGLGGGLLPPPPPPGATAGGPGGPGGAPASTPNASEPLPSLFTAVQELGLRLESAKGPVQVLVIDSVEKPTEN